MKNYMDQEYYQQHLMGPNALKLLAEAFPFVKPAGAERILDLGCGTGLTAMYLAEHTDALIFAQDLWLSASDNYRRFKEVGLEKRIIPIHADATEPVFAEAFFDAVFSIDSYHYFGIDMAFMDKCLAPLVKKGGLITICVPGLKQDLAELPPEMALSWTAEDIDTIVSTDRWRAILNASEKTELISVREMDCYEESWNDWLACDNPYAISDRPAMQAGAGKYMNILQMVCRRK